MCVCVNVAAHDQSVMDRSESGGAAAARQWLLHPASSSQLPHDDGHRDDGNGGPEREEGLVEDVGNGKGGRALLGC